MGEHSTQTNQAREATDQITMELYKLARHRTELPLSVFNESWEQGHVLPEALIVCVAPIF